MKPIQQPYTGFHKVIKRSDKTFVIIINNAEKTISVDRLEAEKIDQQFEDSLAKMHEKRKRIKLLSGKVIRFKLT